MYYYILTFPHEGIQNIIRNSIGLFENQRSNNAGDKIAIKIKKDKAINTKELLMYKRYTYKEILEEMKKKEWIKDI